MDRSRTLIDRSIPFLKEIKDRTAGVDLERWLNEAYGPDSTFFKDIASLIQDGLAEGWVANVPIDGPHYRRSRVCPPSEETEFFSITTVYMDSGSAPRFRGQYHAHPYGEINMVLPMTPGAMLAGPRGWSGPGWTSPEPGSHHYPQVRGGALVSLFYLPAGRISYAIKPAPEEAGADGAD